MENLISITIIIFSIFISISNATNNQCGYNSCPITKENMLNVHLIPHTHLDAGWVKTFENYYLQDVKDIMNNVIIELEKNITRRFVWVEIAFLDRWWEDANDNYKNRLIQLINNGQMEIANGGWTSNDEACTNYQSIIDQYTWGIKRANELLGKCSKPHVGWQVDPFGHSSEMASIFAQFGYDAFFLSRIDIQDRDIRQKNKDLEFIWKSSKHLGSSSDIFTSLLYWSFYQPPPGFVLEYSTGITHDRTKDFISKIREQEKAYKTNHLLVTMGGDFTYKDAASWYNGMDLLIQHSKDENVNIIYSTPACYIKSINLENIESWNVKLDDDFMPYYNRYAAYWTGFFTSRPRMKYYERYGNRILQTVKQLSSLNRKNETIELQNLKRIMGILQHHDAITGTETQAVTDDYTHNLFHIINQTSKLTSDILSDFMNIKPKMDFVTCDHITDRVECKVSEESNKFVLIVYNPIGRTVSNYIRLPVQHYNYLIYDEEGTKIISQMIPICDSIKTISNRESKADYELIFQAKNLPPLGFKRYFIERKTNEINFENLEIIIDNQIKISNTENIIVEVDKNIASVKFNDLEVKHNFGYYTASTFYNQPSGAYVFRPNEDEPYIINNEVPLTPKVYKGPIVEEIYQKLTTWASRIIRLYKKENYVEFDWIIGPIPTELRIGKEIVSIFSSNLQTNGKFYTDSNGRGMIERIRNKRPTWNVTLDDYISGNYYPVTTLLNTRYNDIMLAVVTDRAQGGTSRIDGQLELMVHRRLLADDGWGVNEPLNEIENSEGLTVKGTHYIKLGRDEKKVENEARNLALDNVMLPPVLFFSPTEMSEEDWRQQHKYKTKYKGLNIDLPNNIHLLTLEPWNLNNKFLIRLENYLEMSEDTSVDLKDLFNDYNIIEIKEMNLAANEEITNVQRLTWSYQNKISTQTPSAHPTFENNLKIILSPMQIRTFIVKVDNK